VRVFLIASIALASSLAAAAARAEPDARFVIAGGSAEAREAERARVEAWLAERGVHAIELAGAEPASDLVPERELAVLAAAERALLEARELSARFEQGRALVVLAQAEEALRAALELPLAHAFLAELHVQMALLAAGLGERRLAETALEHAATLDPQRSLQAAEAPPDVLELARSIERRRDGAARSRTPVEVTPPGAEIVLDGAVLGRAPLALDAPPGRHALSVRAAGHVPYAALVELGAGERAPLRIRLAQTDREAARRALLAALDQPDEARAQASALAALGADVVWLFELAPGGARATAHECDRSGCRLRGELRGPAGEAIAHDAPRTRERPAWQRWPFWLGVSASVAAGAALAIWLAHDEHTRKERVLTIDPGAPPPAR
jgi:tetratricopeptide (TPR) repeat protein